MSIRRVVTGHDAGGKSRVVADDSVKPITTELMPGFGAYALWGRDEHPVFPDDRRPRAATAWYPPRNGSRFMVNVIPPGDVAVPEGVDVAEAMAQLDRQMPGAMELNERDSPGVHTTDTIDYIWVVSGEVTLELDDGERTVLRAGDAVVQNGTRHAWRNEGNVPCTIVGFAVGADRDRSGR